MLSSTKQSEKNQWIRSTPAYKTRVLGSPGWWSPVIYGSQGSKSWGWYTTAVHNFKKVLQVCRGFAFEHTQKQEVSGKGGGINLSRSILFHCSWRWVSCLFTGPNLSYFVADFLPAKIWLPHSDCLFVYLFSRFWVLCKQICRLNLTFFKEWGWNWEFINGK